MSLLNTDIKIISKNPFNKYKKCFSISNLLKSNEVC